MSHPSQGRGDESVLEKYRGTYLAFADGETNGMRHLKQLAEAGYGVAIVPSQLQCHRYRLRIVGLTYRGRPLREALTISWDKRRPLPRFATDYCGMLAAYMREIFPISKPTDPKLPITRNKVRQRAVT